jgi:magnesium-protoporphyrin IX monomethyl ester (oxidative) cyclase
MQNILDVLLVSPNGFSYQLMLDKIFPRKYQYDYALCLLAAVLKKNGFKVKIIDGFAQDISIEKTINLILNNKPKILGITTCAATIKEVSFLIDNLKKIKIENNNFKDMEIVLGGRHITGVPDLLKDFEVNYALLGDSENTFPILCDCLLNKKEINFSRGLAKYLNGEIKRGEIEITKDIDNLPFQDLDLFISDKQNFKPEFIFVEASRGCPNRCYFCATPDYRRKVVYKSPEKVVEEIEILSLKYKTIFFIFIDGTFSTNREHTLEICNLLRKKKIKIEWACSERIDTVDRELLKEMKNSGCYAIFFGIESAVDKIRKEFCVKSFSQEKCVEVFKFCNEIGITPSGNFIIGHTNETIFDVKETVNFAMKLDGEIFFKPLMILPDSLIYEQLLNDNRINSDFYHKCENNPLILNPYSRLTEEEIEKQVIKAYRKYYFRIKPTIKLLFINDIQTLYQALKFRWIILIESIKKEVYYPLISYFKKWVKK